jgi:hypothetical protein
MTKLDYSENRFSLAQVLSKTNSPSYFLVFSLVITRFPHFQNDERKFSTIFTRVLIGQNLLSTVPKRRKQILEKRLRGPRASPQCVLGNTLEVYLSFMRS